MGLGKTVEVISLLLSRPPPAGPWDCQDSGHAEARAGTLIVTPQPLLRQWRAELSNHSPQLKVTEYHGLKHLSEALSQAMSSKRPRKNQGLDLDEFARETAAVMENNLPELSRLMIERFARADVVLTTYPVFTDEVHYASPSGDAGRKLRHEKKFPVPQSPLLRVLWWRTVMDEAQMAGSQISSVARMAQRLRSVHSWAVTGTPIGPRGEDDLVDLLRLLRVDTAPWRSGLPEGLPMVQADPPPGLRADHVEELKGAGRR
uniref:E3 ubiquitin-protein ligase SHPRH n=1 Tax=Tetraselmis sp. GSL018 TaxID=582737 RepID=A0A061RD63_9CHLO